MPIAFSLIIPAYNERQRLPRFLDATREYLDRVFPDRYEVIVIDDGSSDGLSEVLDHEVDRWPSLRIIRHNENLGKGAAVRTGVLAAGGEVVLFADADGATPVTEESTLRSAIYSGADVAVGSRFGSAIGHVPRRTWHRGALGCIFASAARLLFRLPVNDTQCGFKMFRSAIVAELFSRQEEKGFLFDIEVLLRASDAKLSIVERSVEWREMPNGRVRLLRDSVLMALGLLRLRWRRAF